MISGRAGRIHWLVAAIWMISLFTPQFVAQHALAADSLWNEPVNGVFTLGTNWFGGVPGPNDVARFETTNSNSFQRTYTVAFANDPINQQLVVEDDNVTLNLIGSLSNHTYTLTNQFVAVALGTVPDRSGNLTVRRGTLNLPSKNPTSAADLEIAPVAHVKGVLTVGAGGGVIGPPDVFVGLNGNGTLDINSGGSVIADAVGIGVNSGSTGTVTITDSGSALFPTSLKVGDQGNGVLNIFAGGRVEGDSSVIGEFGLDGSGNMGTVNVDGNGSMWKVITLVVGNGSPFTTPAVGRLNITGGGRVATHTTTIGNIGIGEVNVASIIPGASSTWAIDGGLFLAVVN
jgi:T5SS/PEP-CTERM-associated repeat protein